MMYSAGFDVTSSRYSFGTITYSTAGKSDAVVTIASITSTALDGATPAASTFFHLPDTDAYTITSEGPSGANRLGRYSARSFRYALRTATQFAMTVQSWTNPLANFDITFSATTGAYTFSYSAATFSIAWSTSLGRQLCGFSGNQSGATSYVGTVVPYFAIIPTLSAVSDPTPNYEPANIANHVTADSGEGYGIAREESPLYRDWRQEFESKAKTVRLSAASTHPFTFQDLPEHCRGSLAFIVTSGGFGEQTYREAFSFRTEGTPWQAERASPANDAQWHVPFRTVVEGRLNS